MVLKHVAQLLYFACFLKARAITVGCFFNSYLTRVFLLGAEEWLSFSCCAGSS